MDRYSKRIVVWIQTEYKRAAAMLPLVLKRAVLLAVGCMVIACLLVFCVGKNVNTAEKMKIGYVAEESQLTKFAITYVQNMEVIQKMCMLEAVEKEVGLQKLENEEFAAVVELPQDIIHEILSGSNAPAVLYLPNHNKIANEEGFRAASSMLFWEFADAAIGTLGIAQAEIYATPILLQELAQKSGLEPAVYDDTLLQTMNDEINRFNLLTVAARENIFRAHLLSVTENATYAVYYSSAFFTIYMLLSGLFFGMFCKRTKLEQDIVAKRLGVPYTVQFIIRCLAGTLLMVGVAMLPFLVFLFPVIRENVAISWSVQGIGILLFIIVIMTIYFMTIYHLVENHSSALTGIGLLALVQAYVSGCLIPSVLLPEPVKAIGKLTPASLMKAGFMILFTGDKKNVLHIVMGLALWGLILVVLAKTTTKIANMLIYRHKQHSISFRIPDNSIRIPSIVMVLLRRLMHRKSIWICMGLVIVLSITIVRTERQAQTQIKAAVYDEQGYYTSVLAKDTSSLVTFVRYESEEEVRQAVLRGEAECGYILPRDLTKNIIAQKANQAITVYQNADAIVVAIVNEVLFERIFRVASLEWYEQYIIDRADFGKDNDNSAKENDSFKKMVESVVEQCINSGATFSFEIEYIGTGEVIRGKEEGNSTYPIQTVVMVTVILCALQGVLQVISDCRKRRFYKRNRLVMAMLTILLPTLLGLLTSGVLLVARMFF